MTGQSERDDKIGTDFSGIPRHVVNWDKTSLIEPCPECVERKCRNCDGGSWDQAQDVPAPCPCAALGHPRSRTERQEPRPSDSSTQELTDAAIRAVNDPGQFCKRERREIKQGDHQNWYWEYEPMTDWQRRALAVAFKPLLDGPLS